MCMKRKEYQEFMIDLLKDHIEYDFKQGPMDIVNLADEDCYKIIASLIDNQIINIFEYIDESDFLSLFYKISINNSSDVKCKWVSDIGYLLKNKFKDQIQHELDVYYPIAKDQMDQEYLDECKYNLNCEPEDETFGVYL